MMASIASNDIGSFLKLVHPIDNWSEDHRTGVDGVCWHHPGGYTSLADARMRALTVADRHGSDDLLGARSVGHHDGHLNGDLEHADAVLIFRVVGAGMQPS